jgi:hypothetical protein
MQEGQQGDITPEGQDEHRESVGLSDEDFRAIDDVLDHLFTFVGKLEALDKAGQLGREATAALAELKTFLDSQELPGSEPPGNPTADGNYCCQLTREGYRGPVAEQSFNRVPYAVALIRCKRWAHQRHLDARLRAGSC